MSALSLLAQAMDYNDYSNYSMNSTMNASDTAAAAGASILFILLTLVFTVIFYVVYAIFLSKIFKKAGVEGWKAWVPIYNNWVLLELGGQQGFWAILALIPIVNIVSAIFIYIAMYHIGLRLQKDGVFVLLAIFLPIVWLIWLAVDKSVWQGHRPTSNVPQAPAAQPPIAS